MNNKNVNSFSENMRKTITAQTNILSLLSSIQKSMTTNDTFVQYEHDDINGNDTKVYELPSYNTIINKLSAIEKSISNLSSGKGTINLTDGTRRQIKLTNIPETPAQITGLEDPSTFKLDTNWFFEDLMFPGATVQIDLTGKIEDSADRVRVSRIILDSRETAPQELWNTNLSVNAYDYISLKALLTYNNVRYSEDIETIELPLVSNTAAGEFQVVKDPEIINGNTWYKVDTINYSTISSDGEGEFKNNILSVGDVLAYENTLYTIQEIDQNTNKIRIKVISGTAIPGLYTIFRYYQDPFRDKTINVRFGANEYNIIYIKGVNEDFNLLSNSWSTPIKFSSNDLIYENDGSQNFLNFYNANIVDWGANMIADAKQRAIKAYYGTIPNAPVLIGNDLRVVQINTQINAAIDTAEVKKTAAEIETAKSQINSLKATIASQKTELQSITEMDKYNSMQQQIATNMTDLQNLQASYSTLVSNLKNIVKDNQAVNVNPKYHVRGFFAIPEYKYRDVAQTIPEEIIGFEIAYRYICNDNTGVKLNTFNYTDVTGTSQVTGTFTDWSIMQGKLKTRVYNNATGLYEWSTENVADGTEININQIDIPITKGEKVEIKVRSISEAGYPENPLRSVWSNSVITEFPDTLSTNNEIADLITEVNDDAMEIAINNTLNSIGVQAHMDDSIANTNSVNGLYYKHEAKNISYENETDTGIESISMQDKINDIDNRLSSLEQTLRAIQEELQAR